MPSLSSLAINPTSIACGLTYILTVLKKTDAAERLRTRISCLGTPELKSWTVHDLR
jgi:hypothetical protein